MKIGSIRIYVLFFLTIFFLAFNTGCGKENPVDKLIPYVLVNFSINPTDINYNNLNIPGNWTYVSGGYRGIILFNAGFGDYKAYERTSPVNFPNDFNCRVKVDESGVIAVDHCSGSKFILLDGSPYEGPATLPLKQYRAHLEGGRLYVSNF
ncbi:MAG: hypothetical protein KKG99_06665 [Bacteroidetes bacterium]|nr:hypothetical protein [Bacteroidota bacterium]